jgi:hypothetical protein
MDGSSSGLEFSDQDASGRRQILQELECHVPRVSVLQKSSDFKATQSSKSSLDLPEGNSLPVVGLGYREKPSVTFLHHHDNARSCL